MKNAILVPGRPDKDDHYDPSHPSNSNRHWFPWLSLQLIIRDILTVAIEPPLPFQPRYELWKKEFERFDITPDTILVGHSCGGGFLVRWLSEHKDVKVGKVVLVAPWTNPNNNPESDTADFFDFEIDPHLVQRSSKTVIFNSDDDHHSIHETVQILRDKIPGIGYREFRGYGHFTYDDLKTEKFPELLEELI